MSLSLSVVLLVIEHFYNIENLVQSKIFLVNNFILVKLLHDIIYLLSNPVGWQEFGAIIFQNMSGFDELWMLCLVIYILKGFFLSILLNTHWILLWMSFFFFFLCMKMFLLYSFASLLKRQSIFMLDFWPLSERWRSDHLKYISYKHIFCG